jgi:hypothetical protein
MTYRPLREIFVAGIARRRPIATASETCRAAVGWDGCEAAGAAPGDA